jgi:hypothetical protein
MHFITSTEGPKLFDAFDFKLRPALGPSFPLLRDGRFVDAAVENVSMRYLPWIRKIGLKDILTWELADDRAKLMAADLVVFNPMERIGRDNGYSEWLWELISERIGGHKSCIIAASPYREWSEAERQYSPVVDLLGLPNVRTFKLDGPSYRLLLELEAPIVWC